MDRLALTNARLRVTHNPVPRNLGGVYKQGIALAHGDYVMYVPGDNENPASALLPVLAAAGSADVVIPYPLNHHVRGRFRALSSKGYTAVLNQLFGLRVPYYDGTTLCRTDQVRAIQIETDTFAYQCEVLIKLLRAGSTFVAVGIEIVPPPDHVSHMVSWCNLVGTVMTVVRLLKA
jgi:hypothetical protein